MTRRPPSSTLFPYTTLFRSAPRVAESIPVGSVIGHHFAEFLFGFREMGGGFCIFKESIGNALCEIGRATSELQSLRHLVCRLLLEKKKKKINRSHKKYDYET